MRIAVAVFGVVSTAFSALADPALVLQNDPTDDEHFVILNKVFEAKTYCFNWDQGDAVVFVDGDPNVCVSATLFNKRNHETCEVWCP